MKTDDLKIEFIYTDRNGDSMVVSKDYTFDANGGSYTIKKGFRSDGISVPKAFWILVSPKVTPESRKAGVIHDWVYRMKPQGWTRKYADDLFYTILMNDGFGFFRAFLAWVGVRLFGWCAWKHNSEDKCRGCPMNCKECYKHIDNDGDEK